MKVLLKRFHLNGHTTGFHPQTQKLEPHTKETVRCESTTEEVSFEWLHQRIWWTDSSWNNLIGFHRSFWNERVKEACTLICLKIYDLPTAMTLYR